LLLRNFHQPHRKLGIVPVHRMHGILLILKDAFSVLGAELLEHCPQGLLGHFIDDLVEVGCARQAD